MIRILHVEDDLDILEIARLSLELSGEFEVTQFGDPEAAIAGAPGLTPDVLLLDFMMPGMSGDQLLARLRENVSLRTVPAIFMTARAQPGEVRDLVAKGACDVIVKPFDPVLLAVQIKSILTRQMAV